IPDDSCARRRDHEVSLREDEEGVDDDVTDPVHQPSPTCPPVASMLLPTTHPPTSVVSTPTGPVGVPYQWARPKSTEESQSACAAPKAGLARASTTTRNWYSSVAALMAAASKMDGRLMRSRTKLPTSGGSVIHE